MGYYTLYTLTTDDNKAHEHIKGGRIFYWMLRTFWRWN